jgi:hypothetical protein
MRLEIVVFLIALSIILFWRFRKNIPNNGLQKKGLVVHILTACVAVAIALVIFTKEGKRFACETAGTCATQTSHSVVVAPRQSVPIDLVAIETKMVGVDVLGHKVKYRCPSGTWMYVYQKGQTDPEQEIDCDGQGVTLGDGYAYLGFVSKTSIPTYPQVTLD